MKRSKVTDEQLAEAVKTSFSVMEVLRLLGIKEAGGSHSHYKRRIEKLKLDTAHFKGRASNAGKPSKFRKSKDDFLVLRESGGRQKSVKLVRSMLESGLKHECSKCGQGAE